MLFRFRSTHRTQTGVSHAFLFVMSGYVTLSVLILVDFLIPMRAVCQQEKKIARWQVANAPYFVQFPRMLGSISALLRKNCIK